MLLSSSQLYDLIKAKKKATETGPRGGRFYRTAEGKRVYLDRDLSHQEVMIEHLLNTPHTSERTVQKLEGVKAPGQKGQEAEQIEAERIKAEASVEPERARKEFGLPSRAKKTKKITKKKAGAKRPPLILESSGKKHETFPAQARGFSPVPKQSWKAYFCKNPQCGAAILPTIAKRGQTILEQAKHYGRVGARIAQPGEIVSVHMLKPDQGAAPVLLEPGEPPPDAVGEKLCPDCFRQYKLVSRTIDPTSRVKVPSTPESRKRERQRKKEEIQKKKALARALKKKPVKRTPEEKKLVEQHEALEATQRKAEQEAAHEQQRSASRRDREEAWMGRQEDAALQKVRASYKHFLIQTEHLSEEEASKKAAAMSQTQARAFQVKLRHVKEKQRKATIKEIEDESTGQRSESYFNIADLQSHMESRRHGVKSGKKRGVYLETLDPVRGRIAEQARTERLTERKAKAKKSLWIAI